MDIHETLTMNIENVLNLWFSTKNVKTQMNVILLTLFILAIFFNYMYILFIRKYIWCKLISYFHAINHIIHNFNFIELEQNIKPTILDVCWILFLIYADTLSFVKFDAYNIRLLRFYKNINVLSLIYKWTTFMYRIGVLDTTARYKIEQ